MSCFGIRGAVDVPHNRAEEILGATRDLLERIVIENALRVEDIVSVVFSVTADLDAVAPARAARDLGWTNTPLFCVQEMNVSGGMARCIRVLMHVNGHRSAEEIQHVYLGEARSLRPDWAKGAGT